MGAPLWHLYAPHVDVRWIITATWFVSLLVGGIVGAVAVREDRR